MKTKQEINDSIKAFSSQISDLIATIDEDRIACKHIEATIKDTQSLVGAIGQDSGLQGLLEKKSELLAAISLGKDCQAYLQELEGLIHNATQAEQENESRLKVQQDTLAGLKKMLEKEMAKLANDQESLKAKRGEYFEAQTTLACLAYKESADALINDYRRLVGLSRFSHRFGKINPIPEDFPHLMIPPFISRAMVEASFLCGIYSYYNSQNDISGKNAAHSSVRMHLKEDNVLPDNC